MITPCLTQIIDPKQAKLRPYDYVILHVGTNDIDNRAPFEHMIQICKIYQAMQIVSAMIHRPCDYNDWVPMLRAGNSFLNKQSKDMNFKLICAFKPFTFCGKPRVELFAKRHRGKIFFFFISEISFLQ